MEFQVSARKYRPGTFQDLIGQPHVVQTLKNAIVRKQVAHAYLFSGMRGVGKTTVARILAKSLNCEQGPTDQPCETCDSCVEISRGNSVDVIEIDGASNTGVDDVRELRENIKFAPFRGSYRVYIIDEVHMLSNSAFNALLKTLEEPPAHAVFVFATTEIHKIPATILSRCQHFNFRRIPRLEIVSRLRHVAEHNGVQVDDRALTSIARASEGSMRDGLSLLDQAVAFGGQTIRHEDLESMLGAVPEELVRQLIETIIQQDSPRAIDAVAQVLNRGYDLRVYGSAVVERIRNLLVAAVVPDRQQVESLMDLPQEEVEQTLKESQAIPVQQLQDLFGIFSRVEDMLRHTMHPRFAFEVAVIRATQLDQQHESAPSHVATISSKPTTPASPRPTPPSRTEEVRYKPTTAPPPSINRPVVGATQGQQTESVGFQKNAPPPKPMLKPPAPKPQISPQVAQVKESEALVGQSRSTSGPILSVGQWEQAVDRLIKEHPNIGTFLEVGTLVTIDADQVVIGYPKTASVACSRIQKEENRGLVAKNIREIIGRALHIRVVELKEGESTGPTIGQLRAKRNDHNDQVLLDEARANPLVKQALEIFGGEVVEARRLSDGKEKG